MISGAGLCWQHVGGVGSTTTTTTTSADIFFPYKKNENNVNCGNCMMNCIQISTKNFGNAMSKVT